MAPEPDLAAAPATRPEPAPAPELRVHPLRLAGLKAFGAAPTLVRPLRGLTVVVGPNGAGKSFLGEAVLFALGA
jgi:hypothetical protein